MSGMGTMAHDNWPWLALIALGAYHGLNPAMGWLFAVALGLQEGRREAVVKAFWPIALGHAAAVTLVVTAVLGLQLVVPLECCVIWQQARSSPSGSTSSSGASTRAGSGCASASET